MKCKIIIASVFLLTFCVSCTNPQIQYLKPQGFIREASAIEEIHSAKGTTYIGRTPKRIYLEYWTAVSSFRKGKTIIYWTETSKLTKEQLNTILNLKAPSKKNGVFFHE